MDKIKGARKFGPQRRKRIRYMNRELKMRKSKNLRRSSKTQQPN